MAPHDLIDESVYLAVRDEQLARRLQREHGLTRRDLLRRAAAAAPLAVGATALARPGGALAQPALPPPAAPGPIVKPLPPAWFIPIGTNAEMRWDAVPGTGYTTPNERFFVRNHTSTPILDRRTWRLRVFGSGLADPAGIELDYAQLRRLPSRTVTHAVECAGNGRSFFGSQQGTPASGSQWKLGAIGVARWRGVPLGEILERAGVTASAVDVMPQGLDPVVVSGGVDQGHVRRPLPIAKALEDALVVYEMNGEPLPYDHGYPARLLVPGWVGIASIKWLGQIEVAAEPLFSPWNTTQYRMVGPSYPGDSPPLGIQPVKSAFELPFEAPVQSGRRLRLDGRSWSGSGPIRAVEVRIDGPDGPGQWQPARLRGTNAAQAWTQWSLRWQPPGPGRYELLARATDLDWRTQPDTVPFNTAGYQFWAVVRHPVVASG